MRNNYAFIILHITVKLFMKNFDIKQGISKVLETLQTPT